jgi:hypothetical protein
VTIYTVHEPPDPPADRLDRAERLVFVQDGFSWLAAFFTPFWMIANRMWLALLAYVAGVAALGLALLALGVGSDWVRIAMLALHLAIGSEAGTLQRWTLDRGGWRMLGAVTGQSLEECERRFIQGWLSEQPIIAESGLARSGEARPSRWRRWFGSRA